MTGIKRNMRSLMNRIPTVPARPRIESCAVEVGAAPDETAVPRTAMTMPPGLKVTALASGWPKWSPFQQPITSDPSNERQSRPDGRCYLPESISYHRLATESRHFGCDVSHHQITTEWFATDSFSNMLFNFGRYWELTGKLPQRVTAISLDFKRDRITHHFQTCVATMGIADKVDFTFLGVGNPPPDLLDQAQTSEARTLQLFRDDPYGVRQSLAAKQGTRNPHRRPHPYAQPDTPLAPVFAAMKAIGQEDSF